LGKAAPQTGTWIVNIAGTAHGLVDPRIILPYPQTGETSRQRGCFSEFQSGETNMCFQFSIVDNTLLIAGTTIAVGRQTIRRRNYVVKAKRFCWAVCFVVFDFIT
jgi:hypothetical protein